MAKEKNCSRCGTAFGCSTEDNGNSCWCNTYPPLFTPDPVINCMCQQCLQLATKEKIDAYVATMTAEKALHDNKAKDLPRNSKQLVEGIDYYIENTFFVFTAWHHLRRGYCCKSGCRHCPYGFKKQTA
ncbi:MAG: DUF5522 domain-containing protein [Lacibacter sp.]